MVSASDYGSSSYCRPWSVGCASFSSCGGGLQSAGSVVEGHGTGLVLQWDVGSSRLGIKLLPLHWQAGSWNHQLLGSPVMKILITWSSCHLVSPEKNFTVTTYKRSVWRHLKPAVFLWFFIKLPLLIWHPLMILVCMNLSCDDGHMVIFALSRFSVIRMLRQRVGHY